MKIWDINSPRAQAVTYAIAEMIVVDNQPLSLVENIGFQRLLKLLKPQYQVPSRKYVTEKILPSIHSKMRNELEKQIQQTKFLSFTTDIWTSNSDVSFLSFTAHSISDDFIPQQCVLRVKLVPGSHTAEFITQNIHEILEEYNIPKFKVHAISSDNAANMLKGIYDTYIDSLPCFWHTLQLVINDCIFNQRSVSSIMTNCRKIVGHFSYSPLAHSKLSILQDRYDLPKHKLIQDVSTRWNST